MSRPRLTIARGSNAPASAQLQKVGRQYYVSVMMGSDCLVLTIPEAQDILSDLEGCINHYRKETTNE